MKTIDNQDRACSSSSSSSSSKSSEITNGFCLKTRSGRAVKYNTDYTERYMKKKYIQYVLKNVIFFFFKL